MEGGLALVPHNHLAMVVASIIAGILLSYAALTIAVRSRYAARMGWLLGGYVAGRSRPSGPSVRARRSCNRSWKAPTSGKGP